MLLHVIKKESCVHFSDDFPNGIALFKQLKKLDLEGIIAKKKDSLYYPGVRTDNWVKIKISNRREFVIGGWSESDNTNSFQSILFGEYVDGKLKFVDHSGGGYTRKEQAELFKKFKDLEIQKTPFANP